MHVFTTVDNRNGLALQGRRLSRDRNLIQALLSLSEGRKLFIAPDSLSLFPEDTRDRLTVSPDFLALAGEGDLCFAENQALLPYEDAMESLTLCRWNRDYPGDSFLDLDLTRWKLAGTREIPGYSHETITLEEYVK